MKAKSCRLLPVNAQSSGCLGYCVSHRVIFTWLELEVLRFVKHRVLLHEQLLIELLYYLRERQIILVIQGRKIHFESLKLTLYVINALKPMTTDYLIIMH